MGKDGAPTLLVSRGRKRVGHPPKCLPGPSAVIKIGGLPSLEWTMPEISDDYKGFDGKGWICDTCGEAIVRAKDGWVQWLSKCESSKWSARDLQLVHHLPASPLGAKRPGCQFTEQAEFARDKMTVSDLNLTHFLTKDGLMDLLSMLVEGGLSQNDVIEMIKRLHIPGYEHARKHFNRAISEGIFEPNTREDFYWQSNIKAVNDWIDEGGE
jgi:hypothetical protein